MKRNNRIRLVLRDSERGSIYHCVSRTVNKEFLWDERAKEVLRRQIWKVAEFCGVEILAYCLMSNHFHILVRVVTGRSASLSDEELLERLRHYYNNAEDASLLGKLEAELLSEEGRRKEVTRKMLLARMDDLSNFVKILKQRFSIWYNRNHQRLGPHWCDRFQSVLVQSNQKALRAVAAYIALNPVRAGICTDPKDYRFNSYTEALVGNKKALQGLSIVTGASDFQSALQELRQVIFAVGGAPKKDGSGAVIEEDAARQVEQDKGELPWSTLLYCKVRHFSQGVAIGSTEYLHQLLAAGLVKSSRKTRVRPMVCQELCYFR